MRSSEILGFLSRASFTRWLDDDVVAAPRALGMSSRDRLRVENAPAVDAALSGSWPDLGRLSGIRPEPGQAAR
ncbi:MAG TPA: hypothetical protein VIX73_29350 [Kofleriaceae bacterium]